MNTGLDRILAHPGLVPELTKGRVGLLAHPASVTKDFVHALTALRGIGVQPKRLFGPEHGWAGHAQDMIAVAGATEAGVAGDGGIISLYGAGYEDLKPKPEHLEGLDVLLIDLQDVGARYYTFIWTAVLVARECHEVGVKVVVLDRPNPIGRAIEGRLQEPEYRSFVGLERIPIRHGLTLGEIVHWRGKVEGWAADIVLAHGQDRWVMPSPNMPTVDTALVYPGGCLLEGTNLSDGRGTTKPFEITGAPWIDGERLARDLKATGLPGFVARPLTFEPTFHKHGKQACGGVQIHVTSASDFRPVATYVALIALAHHQAPEKFAFRTEKYEYVDDKPAFDILTGSRTARERIARGDDPLEIAEWVSEVDREARNLVREARG